MIRETYKGRKIVVKKGRDFGTAALVLNGVAKGSEMGTQEAVLARAKRWIDHIGERVDGASWTAEWYAPGTYEMCPEGLHPQEIGGKCLHPSCGHGEARRP